MIYRLDECSQSEANIFTRRDSDESRIIYCLTDDGDYEMTVGKNDRGVYTVKRNKNFDGWEMSVCDFIGFYETRGKNIGLSVSREDLNKAEKLYNGHKYNDAFLRENEPDVLIHSTTLENLKSIVKDKCLKSWNILKYEKAIWEDKPIGTELGDPIDFRDFIMFSAGSISGEIVVLSKQNGKIVMDCDMEYNTGARLYFDGKKIAADGLLIRDGIHLMVKDKLPLEPYLLWCATWHKLGLKSRVSTPKEFTEKLNMMFNRLFGKNIKTEF